MSEDQLFFRMQFGPEKQCNRNRAEIEDKETFQQLYVRNYMSFTTIYRMLRVCNNVIPNPFGVSKCDFKTLSFSSFIDKLTLF